MTRHTWQLALAAVVTACGGGDSEGSLEGLPEFCQEVIPKVDAYLSQFDQPIGERFGGTAVVGTVGEMPQGMNALVSADYDGNQHQTFASMMTLIRFDADFQPRPYLAESWEFDEGEGELTFRLRDDVYWRLHGQSVLPRHARRPKERHIRDRVTR